MQPLLVLAPFLGYLAAYLIDLGKAGYYRIPTEYVSVGVEDALSSGCVLIVLAVVAMVFYEYLVNYAAWKWVEDPYSRWGFTIIDRYRSSDASIGPALDPVDPQFRDELLRGDAIRMARRGDSVLSSNARRLLSRSSFIAVSMIVALVLSVAFSLTLVMLCSAMDVSTGNLGGRDFFFVGFLFLGFVALLVAGLYLYRSRTGRLVKERPIPGDFGGIRNKHLVSGMAVMVFLGGLCYMSGFHLAAVPQAYLVDFENEKAHVVLDIGSNGNMVVADLGELDMDPVGEGNPKWARLTGSYRLASLAEGSGPGGGAEDFRWANLAILREGSGYGPFAGSLRAVPLGALSADEAANGAFVTSYCLLQGCGAILFAIFLMVRLFRGPCFTRFVGVVKGCWPELAPLWFLGAARADEVLSRHLQVDPEWPKCVLVFVCVGFAQLGSFGASLIFFGPSCGRSALETVASSAVFAGLFLSVLEVFVPLIVSAAKYLVKRRGRSSASSPNHPDFKRYFVGICDGCLVLEWLREGCRFKLIDARDGAAARRHRLLEAVALGDVRLAARAGDSATDFGDQGALEKDEPLVVLGSSVGRAAGAAYELGTKGFTNLCIIDDSKGGFEDCWNQAWGMR